MQILQASEKQLFSKRSHFFLSIKAVEISLWVKKVKLYEISKAMKN